MPAKPPALLIQPASPTSAHTPKPTSAPWSRWGVRIETSCLEHAYCSVEGSEDRWMASDVSRRAAQRL